MVSLSTPFSVTPETDVIVAAAVASISVKLITVPIGNADVALSGIVTSTAPPLVLTSRRLSVSVNASALLVETVITEVGVRHAVLPSSASRAASISAPV